MSLSDEVDRLAEVSLKAMRERDAARAEVARLRRLLRVFHPPSLCRGRCDVCAACGAVDDEATAADGDGKPWPTSSLNEATEQLAAAEARGYEQCQRDVAAWLAVVTAPGLFPATAQILARAIKTREHVGAAKGAKGT